MTATHPDEAFLNRVLHALADATRRRMLDLVKAAPGANVGEVCARFDMSRIGAMKHLRVLEEADLLRSEKVGRERRLYLNAVPIQLIHDRWTSEYSALWAAHLTGMKYRLENPEEKGTEGETR